MTFRAGARRRGGTRSWMRGQGSWRKDTKKRRLPGCPTARREKRSGTDLLDRDIVLDVLHARDGPRNLFGARLFLGGVDETAQLYRALEGVDADLHRVHGRVLHERGLHLGGDGCIVDHFAGALAGAGGRTAGLEDGGDTCKGQDGGKQWNGE